MMPSLARWLPSWSKGVLAFLFWSFVFGVSYTQAPLYYSNQNQYFLHGLAAAGLGDLHQDWLANTKDPTPVFSWIVEFPMFAWVEEEKTWAAMHHPFTAPRPQDAALLKTEPGKCRAQAYDLVINGSEAGGGTIRIHDQQLQQEVFALLGIDAETARQRFGFLLDALQFGAPPHGGIALGIDRFVMLFGGLNNIRDCIAFPKTQKAADLMTDAPGTVDAKQLRELGIQLRRADAAR